MAIKDIQTRPAEPAARMATTQREGSEARTALSNQSPQVFDSDDLEHRTPLFVRGLPIEPSAEERLTQVFAHRYRLEKVLGSGGMGIVYLAHDLELDLDLALKLIRQDVANIPSVAKRFRREVRIARQVTHPNVSRTFDIASHGADLFITMEHVSGRTLSACISELPFQPRQIAEIGVQICSALAAAHRAGVVHRDLKPQNIMLEQDGSGAIIRVVLMDFGIAQALDSGQEEVTGRGQLVGTPAYMSPEQLSGLKVDARADLFAFGVILFELLTGVLPWGRRSAAATARSRANGQAPNPQEFVPTIPTALAVLARTCLASLPGDRPSTAEKVALVLQRWLASREGSCRA